MHYVNSSLFLDIVVRDNMIDLETFAGKDNMLLIMENSLFLFGLVFTLGDSIGELYIGLYAFCNEVFHEYLHEIEYDVMNYYVVRVNIASKVMACIS
jgi:hypothetical protein